MMKANIMKAINSLLRFHTKVKYSTRFFFSVILCLLVFQKCLFEILERTIYLGLTYSAACQICWVIWYFPVLSLDRDILYFAQERLIESSTIWSAKCN